MKISVIFIVLISYVWNIQCATTGIHDVAPVLSSTGNIPLNDLVQSKPAAVGPIVRQSLASPSDATTFGPMLDGVLIEPVPTNTNGILSQFPTYKNVPIPIYIKDDNLLIKTPSTEKIPIPILIKDGNLATTTTQEENVSNTIPKQDKNVNTLGEPSPEPTPKPILITDDNLMLTGVKETTNKELAPEPTPKPILIIDDNLMLTGAKEKTNTEHAPEPTPKPILIIDDNLMLTGAKEKTNTEHAPEPTPKPILIIDDNLMLTGAEETPNTESMETIKTPSTAKTIDPVLTAVATSISHQHMKPCPEFDSRYEKGTFVVTLDDGKCEMIVNQKTVEEKQSNQWAQGRYSPVYQLLTRKYKPEVTFRRTSLAPKDYLCHHHTRKMGSFFVVDTVLGRCQMVIGIPTLPDLRYIMSNTRPAWTPPMRNMPRWPRRSSDSDSSDD
ncbi:unnamed protein product [Mytilus coruscus]|uniref:Uncharacterized protein n=1 Tax=Mytilus coruscus TaxID=42192 RepID=A0A6J8D5M9_MYTCO|nr:unnamed protein product [Mytilus coruscus]